MSSKCAIGVYNRSISRGYEVYILDIHTKPKEPLSVAQKIPRWLAHGDGFDLSDTLSSAKTLRHPIRTCLPFRVFQKRILYGDSVGQDCDITGTLTDDGVTVVVVSAATLRCTAMNMSTDDFWLCIMTGRFGRR